MLLAAKFQNRWCRDGCADQLIRTQSVTRNPGQVPGDHYGALNVLIEVPQPGSGSLTATES